MDGHVNDQLFKPDMVAILDRTHLTTDLKGFLLPVFESLSNAFDGIETRFGNKSAANGKISIRFSDLADPKKLLISVTDKGCGLNKANYISFRTPFSGLKLKKRGRGFGRFISFKVFDRIHYTSRFENGSDEPKKRCFRFDIKQPEEIIIHDGNPDFEGLGTRVEFNSPLPIWNEVISSLDQKIILEEFGVHFLPYFLNRKLPKVTVQFDDNAPEDIVDHFAGVFVQFHTGKISCKIDDEVEELSYTLTKIEKTTKFKQHNMLLSAADRIVGAPRDLSRKLGVDHFTDGDGKKYIIIAVVSGAAFESRLNDARTSIALQPSVLEDLVSAVSSEIEKVENEQVKKLMKRQSSILVTALKENPILRLGLRGRSLDEYISSKPNSWRAEDFVSDLALSRYRASNDLSKKLVAASHDEKT